MASCRRLVLLALLLASSLCAETEVCGPSSAELGTCTDEESALVQVKAQASRQRASGRTAGSGSYDYHSFHLGDWPEFAPLCGGTGATGFQAPINIAVDGADYEMTPYTSWPKFYAKDGGCDEAYFVEKGTAWQVDFMNPKKSLDCRNLEMEWKGKVYVLVQFHFHTLSEDTVDFQPAPMQMHMVHLAADGSYAVVGVLIKTDGSWQNGFLKEIFETGFSSSRMVTSAAGGRFNPYEGVLTKFGKFWHYEGSFTTPPCTEGVDFLISQTPVTTSALHVTSYMEYLKGTGKGNSYGQNHRPIQPLNGREITTGRFLEVCPKGPVPDCGKLDPQEVQRCEELA